MAPARRELADSSSASPTRRAGTCAGVKEPADLTIRRGYRAEVLAREGALQDETKEGEALAGYRPTPVARNADGVQSLLEQAQSSPN